MEQQQLQAAIAALEAQRALLGDDVLEAALGPMRARLASLGAAQKLKYVTILFLDVVGSTTLSQQLDPEDVHWMMDGALARCSSIIQAHRGKVLKYAGDNVLAVFGADETREDDAQRAVLCGLELLQEGRAQSDLARQRLGLTDFNVRIGIHTGEVLLGGGVDAENNIRGFHVNVAARMEQCAPVGALRISHDTYRHVRGVFEVAQQDPIDIKGVNEPMVTYLVLRSTPQSTRALTHGIEGLETRMIGREAELQALQQVFQHVSREPCFQVVHVVAEAGMGKSRLLHEFEKWVERQAEPFYFFQGRAHSITQSQPYGLLRDIIASKLQISDSDPINVARAKLERSVVPLFLADDGPDMALAHAQLMGHLIGLDYHDSQHVEGIKQDGKQIRNRGFHAAAQWIRRVAAREGLPILMVLDDLHWADPGSLDFLKYFSQINRDLPLFLLTFSRPAPDVLVDHATEPTDIAHIKLDALDKQCSRLLVNELLKNIPLIPSALRELITGGAEGNPFYMEELVKMLIDEGAIVIQSDHWAVHPEKLLSVHVPATLTGVLQARLDRLKAEEKLALQEASVIGFVFWDQALSAINPHSCQALEALGLYALVVKRPDGGMTGVREFAFAHQILHQVTYETLLKRTRRDLHARAAAWFTELSGVRANDFLGVTAEHFVKAGNPLQGCEYFARAAEHAGHRYAHEATNAYVTNALELLPLIHDTTQRPDESAVHQLHWRLLDVRERALDLDGNRDEQQAVIATLQGLADMLDDNRKRCEVAWRRSNFAMRTGDYAVMQSSAQRVMELAGHMGDAILELRGQQRLALALAFRGDPTAGRQLAQAGLLRAQSLAARPLEALFLNALSVIADGQLDQLASLELDRQDLLINRELGNRRNEAIALTNLGKGWLRLGEHVLAHRYLEDGLRICRSVGDRATEPNTLISLSALALREGDTGQAWAHAHTAIGVATVVGNHEYEAIAQWAVGNAALADGQHTDADKAFERAHVLGAQVDSAVRLDALAGLARVALARADTPTACGRVDALLVHMADATVLQAAESPCLIQYTVYQVLSQVSDPRATGVLLQAHSELQAVLATIPDDELRGKFMNAVPENRAMLAAWNAAYPFQRG